MPPVLSAGKAEPAGLSMVPEPRDYPQGATVSRAADSADWTQAGLSGHRGAPMRMSQVRSELRGTPPFASAYVSYTHRLQAFIEDLRGCMTVADLAAVTGLSWDTVKNIIKSRREKDYGHPRLKDLQQIGR